MRLTISAQVTVDLTAIGGRKGQFPGKLSYDDLGVPAEVEFDAAASSDDTINATTDRDKLAKIVGQPIVVATHHERLVKTTLAALGRVSFHDGSTIRFNAHVGPSETTTAAAAVANAATWRFDLANVRLHIGDEWVEHHLPAPDGGEPRPNGRSRSRLRFTVDGREWMLTDELFRMRRNGAKPANVPVESATLTTPFVQGDTAATVAKVALDVEQLLRLALCRDVRFVTLSAQDSDGNLLTSTSRAVHVEPEYVGGRPPVDNWHAGVLRAFVEAGQPVLAADREWWHHTLGLYWHRPRGGGGRWRWPTFLTARRPPPGRATSPRSAPDPPRRRPASGPLAPTGPSSGSASPCGSPPRTPRTAVCRIGRTAGW